MLKFINSVLAILTFTFIVTGVAYAQNPDPEALRQQFTCGGIGEKCCQAARLPIVEFPDFGIPGVNILVTVVNNVFKLTLNPLSHAANLGIDQIYAGRACHEGNPTNNNNLNDCFCALDETEDLALLCSPIKTQQEKQACVRCAETGIWTSLGCVDFTLQDFMQNIVFGWGIGFAGFAALACIMWAAFSMQISQGDPGKIKKAQEMLTACITGLILIIFSVFILRFIGVNILRIPGFG